MFLIRKFVFSVFLRASVLNRFFDWSIGAISMPRRERLKLAKLANFEPAKKPEKKELGQLFCDPLVGLEVSTPPYIYFDDSKCYEADASSVGHVLERILRFFEISIRFFHSCANAAVVGETRYGHSRSP